MATAAAVPATTANAGFWVRVGAYLIDSIILAIPGFIIQFRLFNNNAAGQGIVFVLEIAYFVYFWSAAGGGQTLGMKVLGLKVVKTDGALLAWSGALLRFVGAGRVVFGPVHRGDLGRLRPQQAGLARQDRGHLRSEGRLIGR